MKKRLARTLVLEFLEDRLTPSLTIMTDVFGNLTISGTPDTDVANLPGSTDTVTVTATAASTYSITETNGAAVTTPVASGIFAPGNVTINFSQSALDDTINVDLTAGSMTGGLIVDSGAGNDALNIMGGSIGGSVRTTNVNNWRFTNVAIGGNVSLNAALKNGTDNYLPATVNIGGNFSFTGGNGVNTVVLDGTVGGSAQYRAGNGLNSLTLDAGSTVGTSLTYIGGNGLSDSVDILGTVGGTAYVNLGGGGPANAKTLSLSGTVGGSMTVLSSGFAPVTVTTFTGTVGSNLAFNLGNGNNSVDLGNGAALLVGGPSITYTGGVGTDSVTWDTMASAPKARLTANLGAGMDTFTLNSASLSSLYIDFGPGVDTWTNNVGFLPFRTTLLNLP